MGGKLSGECGQVDIVISMFLFLLILLVAMFQFKAYVYMAAGAYVEDALAVSDLASALIDVEEYGRSHTIQIADTEAAFRIYRDALWRNLALDDTGQSSATELLVGNVQICEYIVYNVQDNQVQIIGYDGEGKCTQENTGIRGAVYTPDGKLVEHTTIYSRIGFQVPGLSGHSIAAEKEKSVDITRYESEK